MEIELGRETEVLGHSVTTTEVVHYPARHRRRCASLTARRCSPIPATPNGSMPWYPSPTVRILFIVECYGYSGHMPGRLSWEVLEPRLPDLRARRIMLTHMSPLMLAHLEQARASGVLVAEDGAVLEF